jgi:release factor H-coupled RctB family protein
MHGRVHTRKSDLAKLTRNPFGGMILCEDRDLLVEETGDAYKNVDRTIADLAEFGVARAVASFLPLITFKTVRASSPAKPDKPWREDRRSSASLSPRAAVRRNAGSRSSIRSR